MINKKTKSFGVVLLSILMIFSLVIFTACEPLDPADPPSNPPANIYTKENAITVLTNASTVLKQEPLPSTAAVNVGTEGMTEYKGIDGWELNSVDFIQEDNGDTSHIGKQRGVLISFYKRLLNANLININEDYETFKNDMSYTVNQDYIYFKIKFEDNKMILYTRSYIDNGNIQQKVLRYLITFNNELQVQNVVYEQIQGRFDTTGGVYVSDCRVEYFANNSSYFIYCRYNTGDEMNQREPIKGLIQSLNAESAARVKPTTEIVDLEPILREFESQPQN